jgi:adenylosuccinate lyase
MELLDLFSKKLGLAAPLTAWHASRDRSAEFLSTLAMIAGTMAKIGDEIRCLSRNEIGEMEEPFTMGKIGSSTMPHKRNPEMCEQAVVLARLIKSNALLGFEGLINDHERDYRTVRLEWVTITDSSLFMCGQLSIMKDLIKGLIVYEDRIRENVNKAATLISTEALMFYLGKTIGKQTAHTIVYETSMEAIETQQPLIDLLMEHPEITGKFNREELKSVIDPGNHIGLSKELTDKAIHYVTHEMQQIQSIERDIMECPLSEKEDCCNVKY